MKVVTLEGSSCPVEGKKVGGGHVGRFIVPGEGEKGWKRSRKSVHRARWKGKWLEALTLEGRSWSVVGKKVGGVHVGAWSVPGEGGKGWRRSRLSVHRARWKGKWLEAVTLELASYPVEGKMAGGSND